MSSEPIPAGMKPWTGGDSAPDDWEGGPVLLADDTLLDPADEGDDQLDWGRAGGEDGFAEGWWIVAYTPRIAAAPRPTCDSEVTQADEDAAAALWLNAALLDYDLADDASMRADRFHKLFAAAFARHRLTNQAEVSRLREAEDRGYRQAIADAANMARQCPHLVQPLFVPAIEGLTATRALNGGAS